VSDILEPTPLYCPVCETAMVAKDDDDYFRLFACCKECGMKWAEVNRSNWSMGWRPDIADVKNEISNRRQHIFNEIDILRGS